MDRPKKKPSGRIITEENEDQNSAQALTDSIEIPDQKNKPIIKQ